MTVSYFDSSAPQLRKQKIACRVGSGYDHINLPRYTIELENCAAISCISWHRLPKKSVTGRSTYNNRVSQSIYPINSFWHAPKNFSFAKT